MSNPPPRSQGGTTEYLLIVAVIAILTLGAFTVFGEDLRSLLRPGDAPAGPAWPAEVPAGDAPAGPTPALAPSAATSAPASAR